LYVDHWIYKILPQTHVESATFVRRSLDLSDSALYPP
jgi:hypothetical protein